MPEPDPQPPQPRPIHPARWLLMLVPSVLTIGAPFVGMFARQHIYESHGVDFTPEFLSLAVALLLSFFLGFLLEKWRGGNLRDWSRPIGFGLLILIVNGFISFGGCALVTTAFNL